MKAKSIRTVISWEEALAIVKTGLYELYMEDGKPFIKEPDQKGHYPISRDTYRGLQELING